MPVGEEIKAKHGAWQLVASALVTNRAESEEGSLGASILFIYFFFLFFTFFPPLVFLFLGVYFK